MEIVLNGLGNKQRWRMRAILTTALLLSFLSATSVFAVNHTSTLTGYAWGNKTGANGTYLDQGNFANHSSQWCPNDPSASWAFGTSITMVQPVGIVLWSGTGTGYLCDTFTLQDIGDPTCAMPNYWADIYFGKYALPGQVAACSCPGSPAPGYCISTSHDNCQDATNHGSPTDTYSAPS